MEIFSNINNTYLNEITKKHSLDLKINKKPKYPCFEFKDEALQFSFTDKIFLKLDFLKGTINYRLQRAHHEKHLKKAIGKNKEPQLILDGTAGLLSDTLILLSLGLKIKELMCQIIVLQSHQVLAAVLCFYQWLFLNVFHDVLFVTCN